MHYFYDFLKVSDDNFEFSIKTKSQSQIRQIISDPPESGSTTVWASKTNATVLYTGRSNGNHASSPPPPESMRENPAHASGYTVDFLWIYCRYSRTVPCSQSRMCAWDAPCPGPIPTRGLRMHLKRKVSRDLYLFILRNLNFDTDHTFLVYNYKLWCYVTTLFLYQ